MNFSNQLHPNETDPTAAVYRWMLQNRRQYILSEVEGYPDAESLAEAAVIELEIKQELAGELAAEVGEAVERKEQ